MGQNIIRKLPPFEVGARVESFVGPDGEKNAEPSTAPVQDNLKSFKQIVSTSVAQDISTGNVGDHQWCERTPWAGG